MPTQREAYDFYKKHKSATFKLKAPTGMNTAELNSAISKLIDKKDTPASVRKEWQKLSLKSDAGIGDIEKNIKAVKKKQLKEGTIGKPAQARPEKPKPKPKPKPKTDNVFDTVSLKDLQDILKSGIQPTSMTKKLTPEMISEIKSAIKKKGGTIPETKTKTKTKTKKPKITNPNKPVTEKEDFLDILSIASQVGKSKDKSSSVEDKVEISKLKSRINRVGGKISFKLFDEILDDIDDTHEIRQQIEDNVSDGQGYNMDYWISQVSKKADTFEDLTDKQQDRLYNLLAKDMNDELKLYTKNFYEKYIKGKKGLTYEQITQTIRDDFGAPVF